MTYRVPSMPHGVTTVRGQRGTPEVTVYLRPSELADRWRISTQKLANDRCAGRGLPYTKVGGSVVLYALADVEEFEAQHRVAVGR